MHIPFLKLVVISPACGGSFGDTYLTEWGMKAPVLRGLSLLLEKAGQDWFEFKVQTSLLHKARHGSESLLCTYM